MWWVNHYSMVGNVTVTSLCISFLIVVTWNDFVTVKKENASLEHFSLESKLADFPKLIKFQQQKELLCYFSCLPFPAYFSSPLSAYPFPPTLTHRHPYLINTLRDPLLRDTLTLIQWLICLKDSPSSHTPLAHGHPWFTNTLGSRKMPAHRHTCWRYSVPLWVTTLLHLKILNKVTFTLKITNML